jgi:type II secretory pathway component GspD/PulD (secretin)
MKRLCIVFGLVVLVSAVRADTFSTLQLQNRPAEEVIPIIKPMLGADDAITGEGFKIFLRSSPETLALVRNMIDVLDTPAKILQVSVFQGSERELGELAVDARIQIESGDASVDIGSGAAGNDDPGGSITYSTTNGSASINGVRTQKSLRDNPIHQVRVTEGTEAYIETGERIPYFYGAARIGPGAVAGGVEYKNATTGFYVLPRVRGNSVVLDISPYKSLPSNTGRDNVDTLSAGTTITGRVGQWLLVGGITEQLARTQSATGTTVRTHGGDSTGIWVRADLVQ